jgi:hypothetical protein
MPRSNDGSTFGTFRLSRVVVGRSKLCAFAARSTAQRAAVAHCGSSSEIGQVIASETAIAGTPTSNDSLAAAIVPE